MSLLSDQRRKIVVYIAMILCFIGAISCRNGKEKRQIPVLPVFDETAVISFARQVEQNVNALQPDFFNNAFAKTCIKEKMSDNSIVQSSFDTDFGPLFFENNFKWGDHAVNTVQEGGDFKFARYYEQDGEHHVIFRTYQDFAIEISDFIVDTVQGKIRIIDGFLYKYSTSLIEHVKQDMLLQILARTRPDETISLLMEIDRLLKNGNTMEASRLLKENEPLLQEYPIYDQYKMQTLFLTDKKQLEAFLDQADGARLDHRSVLFHKLHLYAHAKELEKLEKIVDELIFYTGDDPVYLLIFGKSAQQTGDYETALFCYENALSGMPMIWDIWYSKLEVYEALQMEEKFDETLLKGKEAYGMNDDELKVFKETHFRSAPKSRK